MNTDFPLYNPVQVALQMVQESLRRDARRPQELDRQVARLERIIEEFHELGCPLHGSDKCPSVSWCLAKEIVERKISWE